MGCFGKIKAMFSKGAEKVKSIAPKRDFRNLRVLKIAAAEIGVKEVKGHGSNSTIVKYHAYARKDNDVSKGLADSIPWCASFVCYCLEVAGMGSTNSMAARSYEKWGVSSRKKPLPGDIVVFWRGNSSKDWRGHVGFFLDETDKFIYVLGGNQLDAVRVSRYSKTKLLDIRRSSKHKELTEVEEEMLWDIADALVSGKSIDDSGKVV